MYDNQFESTLFEAEWEKIYYAAESDAGLFDDMLNPKKNQYELYSFTTVNLKNRMFDAAIAKTTVGVATTQYWAWSDAVTLYYNRLNGKRITINGETFTLKKMSNDVRKELISFYAIILQELVIGAIKHVENGSQGYQRFMLERMAQSNERRYILAALQESVPFMLPNSREETSENQLKAEVLQFMFYIATLFSKTRLDLFGDLGQLYSQYNGGKAPTKELNPLVNETTFYQIISLIDTWKADCVKPKVDKAVLKSVEAPF